MMLRIQDAEGRGPWRPGFSQFWIDPDKDDSLCPPMMVEFPNWREAIGLAQAQGLTHFGCCVLGVGGLHRWFTPPEMCRLRQYGYFLVDASMLKPILRGKSQIIGASRKPLAGLPIIGWDQAA